MAYVKGMAENTQKCDDHVGKNSLAGQTFERDKNRQQNLILGHFTALADFGPYGGQFLDGRNKNRQQNLILGHFTAADFDPRMICG